jgi:uncharacterized protein (TIGR02186 family)
MRRWLLALLFFPLLAPAATAAEPLIADISTHFIAITTGFTGANMVLFGATEGSGDIIVVVRGPEHDVVVRRKSRVAGLWVNTRDAVFSFVPSYYAVYSSHPLEEIAPPPVQALHQIGLANLRFDIAGKPRAADEVAAFRAALIREHERDGLFRESAGRVYFLGDRLFRADIALPANLPTGEYRVEIYLVREGAVVAAQTSPLFVSQAGLDADVDDFADRHALLYGIVAVAGAAMAGWLASLPFRNA